MLRVVIVAVMLATSHGGGTLPIAEHWFNTIQLEAPLGCGYQLYRTRETHMTMHNDGIDANSYLLKGDGADMIVDTGLGLLSLYEHLRGEGLLGDTTRALTVIASHEHFDHAGGLHHFNQSTRAQIVVGTFDANAVATGNNTLTAATEVRGYASNITKYWDAVPYANFRERLSGYTVQSRVSRRVQFGDVIALGSSTSFSVLELPGHTPGSIGLWNVNGTKELFTGDAIYDAELYDFCVDSDKSAYRATFEFMLTLNISMAFPGHEEVLDRRRYQAIIDCYLAGINPCPHN